MMNKPEFNCDPGLLQRSLDDELSQLEEDQLSGHLCECGHCQTELERLAGNPDAWNRVGTTLKSAGDSNEENSVGIGNKSATDEDFATDFAVECLEPSTSPDSIGRLGDIEIVEVIGHGGMGFVLKGYQSELQRLVAVKVLAPQLAVSAASRKRFAREAQATAAILHPNVMPILTVDSSGRLPYIVMPYVECESLQQRIDLTGPLPLVDILRIGTQVANGLAAAHAQGLVHRDVKPANILLGCGVEKVMLTDFGLARAIDDASITRTGMIAGTPLYMSPEQSRGEPIDSRSDLFSLGSVLYTLSTGRTPFRSESTYGILRRLTEDTPRPIRDLSPQLPRWFGFVVDKLLSKQPDDRYSNAAEVAELLEGCLAHIQQPDSVPLPAECETDVRSRRSLWLWSAIALIAFACCIAGWKSIFDGHASGRAARSEPPGSQSVISQAGDRLLTTENDALSSPLKSSTDWDRAGNDIETLRNDFEKWNQRAEGLWDDPP